MRGESRPVDFWITVPEGERVSSGDAMMLTIGPSALVAGSALVYLLPLAGLVLGAVMAEWLVPGSEAVIPMAGIAGLVSGLLLVRTGLKHAGRPGRFEPVFLRTLPVSNTQVT